MESMRVGRNLQAQALIPHGIVIGDDAIFLHAQNISEIGTDPRDEGRARLRGRHRKAPVVGREKLGEQIPVRCRQVRNPGERQFLGQPILQGAEDALGAAAGFRRIGSNQRDPQLL
jgi:hypothetical protein